MKKRATVTSRGRITIPTEVRRRLGLEEGDQVEFIVEEGRTILRAIPATHVPFARFAGVLGSFADADDVRTWARELRDDD
jgi:antitoxin PrlF